MLRRCAGSARRQLGATTVLALAKLILAAVAVVVRAQGLALPVLQATLGSLDLAW